MKIKAVTFDLWFTLLCGREYTKYRVDLLSKFLEKEKFIKDRNLVEEKYLMANNYYTDVKIKENRHISAAERLEYILKNLNINLPEESKCLLTKKFEEAIFINIPPLIDGAEMVLKSLHKKYRIGLICDSGFTPGRILRHILKNHNILKYFKCTVFSDELGLTKPHPLIFKTAVKKLEVNENDVMHVGDLLKNDVAGAKSLGMEAVWFNREKYELNKNLKLKPDYEITSLSELLEILNLQ